MMKNNPKLKQAIRTAQGRLQFVAGIYVGMMAIIQNRELKDTKSIFENVLGVNANIDDAIISETIKDFQEIINEYS